MGNDGTLSDGFASIANNDAVLLILGSMPGVASLQAGQYYAHPRNAFWPIMGGLFGATPELTYPQRMQLLVLNKIAVWDVLQRCSRIGSLDADIDLNTIQTNDFSEFFAGHKMVVNVFFNGGAAEKLYRRFVLPDLGQRFEYLRYQRLPSTSPAYAAMKLPEKIAAWQVIKQAASGAAVLQ
jgi:TDG/mug DNA glycosylase family protein